MLKSVKDKFQNITSDLAFFNIGALIKWFYFLKKSNHIKFLNAENIKWG